MINLDNLIRQHNTILTEISFVMEEVEKRSTMNGAEIALHINKLAGHLNMHLMNEDKFLYPKLLNSSDLAVKNLALQYNNEMGDLVNIYSKYKNDYNTSNKINECAETFVIDTMSVMKALKKRIDKEDNGLYKLIKDKNL